MIENKYNKIFNDRKYIIKYLIDLIMEFFY